MNKILVLAACLFCLCGETAHAQSDVPKFEIGAQFTTLTIKEVEGVQTIDGVLPPRSRTEPGFGGRLTYNVTDHIAAEAEVNFFPDDDGFGDDAGFGRVDEYSGGRIIQGLFGVKAGKRFERIGIFGKARPGFVRFGRISRGVALATPAPQRPAFVDVFDSQTEFAADLGGVVEFYPSRRIVARFDIGDTIIRYRERTVGFPGASSTGQPLFVLQPLPAATKHNLQTNLGIGFRF